MMKRILVLFIGLSFALQKAVASNPPTPQPVRSDEGMWLPLLLNVLNYEQMQKLGCKLTPEQIYSINQSSVKDAIVQLGGFCTAEIVSPNGLVLTNHHCGYDAIASHSSPEHDYLTNGFWAASYEEELQNPGLTVSFLQRIEDVTERINNVVKGKPEADRAALIEAEVQKIEEAASEEGAYRAEVMPMFQGNQHFLFVYEVFRDVRLVGAPPSSIGKFGGDTDNWMWPRHTGDFSVLRVYAGPDNKPADPSPDNKPYKPKHYLPVSLKGVKEGDFAFIMGYPGSTDRYLPASGIEQAYNHDNIAYVKVFEERLRVMKEDMDADDAIRIALASDYASLANTWKYFLGQNRGLQHRGLIEEKQAYEKEFTNWVTADPGRRTRYGSVLADLAKNYADNRDVKKVNLYMNLAAFAPSFCQIGFPFNRLNRMMSAEDATEESWMPQVEGIKAMVDGHFEHYLKGTDQKIFASMLRVYYNDVPKEYHPALFTSKEFLKMKPTAEKDRFDLYAEWVFKTSFLVDKTKMNAFLAKPSLKALQADPGVKYLLNTISIYREKVLAGIGVFNDNNDRLMRIFEAGMMEKDPSRKFYPDANFTMRLTYGVVKAYDPRDGVSYDWQTTAAGILEKEVPGDEEFDVPTKLHDLIKRKDFGRYGKNGELVTCFLTNTDITGGNSGSPVMNAEGQLIGLAFDGNWESMTSDLVFDDNTVRTISVDIRYVLFVIDKFAGATRLVNEMTIVE